LETDMTPTDKIRNVAIIAHVDHGKTTMVDQLLRQSGTFAQHEKVVDTVMDNNAIEKEGHARIGGETLSGGEMLDEYVMLSFRSKGLDQADLVSRFGSSWINKNKNFLSKLRQENFVIEKNGLLSLTPKGYAVCDEIIGKFV